MRDCGAKTQPCAVCPTPAECIKAMETAAQTERQTILRVHQALMETVLGGTVTPRETPLTQNPEKTRYVMTVDDLSDYVRRSFNVALEEYENLHRGRSLRRV